MYASFQALQDKRNRKGKRYALATVSLGIFSAKLCGEDKPSEIAEWVKLRGKWLVQLLGLKRESMPHHNTYRGTLAEAIDEQEFGRLVWQRHRHRGRAGYPVVVTLETARADAVPEAKLCCPSCGQPLLFQRTIQPTGRCPP